eukprot:1771111-Pyramimonas_sp.AAC.1
MDSNNRVEAKEDYVGLPQNKTRAFSTTAAGLHGNLTAMAGPAGHAGAFPPGGPERAHVKVERHGALGPCVACSAD